MKSKFILNLMGMLALLCLCRGNAQAQYVSCPPFPYGHAHLFEPNIDMDIFQIRANQFPDFRFRADDYIQYSPFLFMLGLKSFGYDGMSSWGRMATADALSLAFMAVGVNGLKYTFRRTRPDGSARNSFPSGHTATVFTFATLLHLEYGWKSPWFSIGAYSVAASVGIMRMLNNRHWLSDVLGGALIGIGAAHLGYYVTDRIFGKKFIQSGYAHPEFFYEESRKHYDVDLLFYRRFVLGRNSLKAEGRLPERGSGMALDVGIPVIPSAGVRIRGGIGSLNNHNVCNILAGGLWNGQINDRFQYGAYLLAGYAYLVSGQISNFDVAAGSSLALRLSGNFQLKAFVEYENITDFSTGPSLNSINLGFCAGFYW